MYIYMCMYVVWYAGKKENCAKCKIAMYDKMKHYGSDIFKTFFFLGGPSYHFFVITDFLKNIQELLIMKHLKVWKLWRKNLFSS